MGSKQRCRRKGRKSWRDWTKAKSMRKRGYCMLETLNWEEKGEREEHKHRWWKSWRKMDGLQWRQEKEITEETPPRDSSQSWITQSTDPKGNDPEPGWEAVRAVGLCMGFWGRDLADFPEKWVTMGFKCGRAYMKRRFWSLSEDKNWKRTWNVPFCIRCQIADRQRTRLSISSVQWEWDFLFPRMSAQPLRRDEGNFFHLRNPLFGKELFRPLFSSQPNCM